jgi:D-alanyl-D-alanine carboxypeptidase
MRWKGLAVAVAVVVCPILWWPSSALAERATSDAGRQDVSASSGPTSPASPSVSTPTTPATATVQPSPTPTRATQPADAPAPARPAKDTRTSRASPFTVDGIAVISKKHRVNAAYSPTLVTTKVSSTGAGTVRLQPEASAAVTAMFAAAKKAGYQLTVRSAYRSYASQSAWYRTGDHNLVAPAGASEHQSGLAVDLAWLRGTRLVRGTELGSSKAGAWLTKHAAEFGFIVRYPPGTQRITGISFEPWHFRYVGTQAAQGVLTTKSKTLEEYLGLAG